MKVFLGFGVIYDVYYCKQIPHGHHFPLTLIKIINVKWFLKTFQNAIIFLENSRVK